MSEPIKVWDLVVKVRTCCNGRIVNAGIPWQVTGFHTTYGCCPSCGFNGDLLYAEPKNIYVGWLKRIPPLSELESEKRDEKRDEEITA